MSNRRQTALLFGAFFTRVMYKLIFAIPAAIGAVSAQIGQFAVGFLAAIAIPKSLFE